MRILVIISFFIVLGLFIFVNQVPVTVTAEKISEAVSEVISTSEVSVDEEIVEETVRKSIALLEKGQSRRLKYVASAYLVIWLVFMLYALHLERQQGTLDKCLGQLEAAATSDIGKRISAGVERQVDLKQTSTSDTK